MGAIKRVILAALVAFLPAFIPATAHSASPTVVNVFAASSLQLQFTNLAQKFMVAHPGVKISLSFGSSTTLANQIAAGAPVDIFVSADRSSMALASTEISNPHDYITNQIVLALPINSSISKLSDLNKSVKWIQCAHTVPCGVATDKALAGDQVVKSLPVSLESSASATAAKLLAGAVDAAFIYKSDVVANPAKLKAIYFVDSTSASTIYQTGLSIRAVKMKNRWAPLFLSNMRSANVLKSLDKAGFAVDSAR